jgi:hypothetical protein
MTPRFLPVCLITHGLPLVGAAQACGSVNLMEPPSSTCHSSHARQEKEYKSGSPPNRDVLRRSCIGLAQFRQRGGLGAVLLVYLPSMTQSPTCHSDVVLEHYRRVAGSLTFGKTSLTANGHLKPGPGRLSATASVEAGQQFEGRCG